MWKDVGKHKEILMFSAARLGPADYWYRTGPDLHTPQRGTPSTPVRRSLSPFPSQILKVKSPTAESSWNR